MNLRIANIANYFAALLLFTFGIIYFFKSSFMPYHSEALGLPWEDLKESTQTLIIALMRCVGGGYLAVGIGIFILQSCLKKIANFKIAWVIFLIGVIVTGASIYATFIVRLNTPGNPPTTLAFFGVLLFIVGLIFNKRYLHK